MKKATFEHRVDRIIVPLRNPYNRFWDGITVSVYDRMPELSKSNAVLTDIGNSASGPVGWAMMELQKGIAKSKNSIIASAQSLQSNVPDLPEIYFSLLKESLIAPETIEELAKGTQPE